MHMYAATKMTNTSRWVFLLLVAGVAIAGPRMVGSFAQAVGYRLFDLYPAFVSYEIFSGWALAILEGLGAGYISHQWRRIILFDDAESEPLVNRIIPQNLIYWIILAFALILLLFSLPAISTAFLVAEQYDGQVKDVLTWSHILDNHLVWIWSFITAGVPTLLVMTVGIVIEPGIMDEDEKPDDTPAPKQDDDGLPRFIAAIEASKRADIKITHAMLTHLANKHNLPIKEAEGVFIQLMEKDNV